MKNNKYLDNDIIEILNDFLETTSERKLKVTINLIRVRLKIQLTLMKLIFKTMIAANKESQINISPTEVINILKEGNKRFINGNEIKKDFSAEVKGTSSGQYPLACILGCIDSRVPAEIIFDQGIGDILMLELLAIL